MELLIPGLILVGLMVYASTRIKRAAAAAWAPETIETETFAVNKPDGILHVLNGDPQFVFEAYSKEYGTEAAAKIRMARVEAKAYSNASVKAKVKEVKATGTVIEDRSEVIDQRHYAIVTVEEGSDELRYRIRYKIAEKDGQVFVVKAKMLVEADEEMDTKLDAMIESFVLR